jgi:hypothetical protein
MRPISFLFPATLFVLACSASARTMPYPQPDAESGPSVQVSAPGPAAFITEDKASQISGSYAMSNGWHMKVQTSSRYIDARIDDQKPMRLRAVSGDKFVSRDGSVTMQFNQGEYGDDMTMSYVPTAAWPRWW